MKYLDTELATVTIKDVSLDFIKRNGKKLIEKLYVANFQRIFIELSDNNDVMNIYNIVQKYDNVFLCVKNSAIRNIKNCINKIDISELSTIKQNDSCFYQIQYSEHLLSALQKCKWLFDKIIIDIPDDMLSADTIFAGRNLPNTELMFSDFILTTQTIKQHPCNIFLCSGLKCHGKKSTLPRNIFITPGGDVYIHKLPKLIIGNINNDDIDVILKRYIDSPEHKIFIELNRKMYIKYILTGILTTIFTDNCLKRIYDEIV
ncbi:MAG: hypothetical protein ACLRFQ_01725 [Alphaproteobacteria bacterium]